MIRHLARSASSGPLSQFVQCFWYCEGAPLTHSKERLMPNGEAAVIFNLCDDAIRIYDWKNPDRYDTFGHAVVSGVRSEPFVIDTLQQDRVFGIQFHPGGSFPFFRMPSSEMRNRDVSLDCAWGDAAELFRERLLEARNFPEMFAAAEKALLAQLVRPLELHPAVAFAAQRLDARSHRVSVAEVLDAVGISHRRFAELFQDQTGLAPKAFCRVRRFQRVLRRIHSQHKAEWAQIALDCGYYDQAHFIHDFQDFSGFTPTGYLVNFFKYNRRNEHINHVPIN